MKAKSQRAKAPPAVRFRDRIIELRRVKASELLENPKNWRRHPEEQVGAVTSIMERIGFAGATIGRLVDDKIELLDGHLRKSIAGDQEIPVLITDLTEQEAAVFLATYDPLTELAITDTEALRSLLLEAEGVDDAFMRKQMADIEDEIASDVKKEIAKEADVPGMALEPHEHYDFLVVCAQTTHEWNVLCDRLNLKPEARRGTMGTARAIRATRLLEVLNQKAP